jgi:hypothetical protein
VLSARDGRKYGAAPQVNPRFPCHCAVYLLYKYVEVIEIRKESKMHVHHPPFDNWSYPAPDSNDLAPFFDTLMDASEAARALAVAPNELRVVAWLILSGAPTPTRRLAGEIPPAVESPAIFHGPGLRVRDGRPGFGVASIPVEELSEALGEEREGFRAQAILDICPPEIRVLAALVLRSKNQPNDQGTNQGVPGVV